MVAETGEQKHVQRQKSMSNYLLAKVDNSLRHSGIQPACILLWLPQRMLALPVASRSRGGEYIHDMY